MEGTAPVEPPRPLVSPEALRSAVRRLAGEIARAHGDGVLLVAVLKGSVPFLADLVRAMPCRVEVDFLAISSYAPDSGRVRIVKDLDTDIHARRVVLVEDIVDTGLTLGYLLGELRGRHPEVVDVCTLLDRAPRRILPTPLRFSGFEIGDEFVLGYGLDHAERYRNLDRIVVGDLDVLRADPDAYVDALYRA